MFRFLCLESKWRFSLSHLVLALLCLAFAQTAFTQSAPNIVWQTDSGGGALAYSDDGQLLLAGTRLFAAANGTLLRNFVLPYNGGGINNVALSPDGQYAAIGIQSYNQKLDLFRVADGALIKGRITAQYNDTALSIAFSPDEQVIAVGSEDRYQNDGLIRFWQSSTGALLQSYHVGDSDPYSSYVSGFA